MSAVFIDMLNTNGLSESREPRGRIIDKAYLSAIIQAHEHAGFDRPYRLLLGRRGRFIQMDAVAARPTVCSPP